MTSPEARPPFTITDRRGVTRTASGLVVGGQQTEMSSIRKAYKLQAKKLEGVADSLGSMEADKGVKAQAARMRRSRVSNMQRTGSNMQIALPKIRQPLSSLIDKGIPYNVRDPKELSECRIWARTFYSTHKLVPLLVDLYSTFPVQGLEFEHDDPEVEDFFTSMFIDDLDYEEFLPDQLLREYFISGEVTTLGHFSEELGIWSSEEVLNPDMVRVSKSMFNEEIRVQLALKDQVDSLRHGPQGEFGTTESPSERAQRVWEYQQLERNYPEIIAAAAQDDGLDVSEALWSRMVNKANPWDMRGTPFLLRSFRTLMMEESLNCAQDSVADRLYSPLILATLGIQDMGDGEPWIPDPGELDDLREDFQNALAGDFKLLVHHFGLQVTPVFGRESVPRFDQDYQRIDADLMQAWGVGEALIMGGTGAGGTYASSALNREVCENLMAKVQRKVIKHMIKRMEVIAEAQEMYEVEYKSGRPQPVYREVVEEDENGDRRIVRMPKLAIPKVKFRTLNLRDEATERQFIQTLKELGAPVSDKALAINIPLEFDQEIQRQADETVDKLVAEAEAMSKAQQICDQKRLPYPAELANYLTQTLILRQQLAQTEMIEGQEEMQEQQMAQMSPAGQMGLLPGTQAMPGMPGGPPPDPAAEPGPEGEGPPEGPEAGGADGGLPGAAPDGGTGMIPPRNRARPPESDEQRAGAPRAASKNRTQRHAKRTKQNSIRKLSKFETGPSSVGHARNSTPEQIEAAVRRRALMGRHSDPRVSDLVEDPEFWHMLHADQYESQIRADWPEIMAGGAKDSARLLHELVEQYQDATGVQPTWD